MARHLKVCGKKEASPCAFNGCSFSSLSTGALNKHYQEVHFTHPIYDDKQVVIVFLKIQKPERFSRLIFSAEQCVRQACEEDPGPGRSGKGALPLPVVPPAESGQTSGGGPRRQQARGPGRRASTKVPLLLLPGQAHFCSQNACQGKHLLGLFHICLERFLVCIVNRHCRMFILPYLIIWSG